jgi:MFS family permease
VRISLQSQSLTFKTALFCVLDPRNPNVVTSAAPCSQWLAKSMADMTPRYFELDLQTEILLTPSVICFMFFLALFELGSLICGVANSSKLFIVGRAVAGMGGSGIVNGGLTMVAKCIPMEKRGGEVFCSSINL